MAVGDCERAFARAAAAAGIPLVRQSEAWLNQRGHLGLPVEADAARSALERIFFALGGDASAQAQKRSTRLRGDFLHAETGTLIEVDEVQHFTSHRLLCLDPYPGDALLGFDVQRYRELCRSWSARADKYRTAKAAVAFGPGGRQRQRAYHDALRDLAAPAMGGPPVVRADAVDGDGAAAFSRAYALLKHLSS